MVAFSHLSMIAFVILGLSMVRLMINYSSLLAKNYNDNPDDDVFFYWPHTAFSFSIFKVFYILKKIDTTNISFHPK